jgi:hypothetical protein
MWRCRHSVPQSWNSYPPRIISCSYSWCIGTCYGHWHGPKEHAACYEYHSLRPIGSAKSHFAHLWYKYGTFSCRTLVRKVKRNPSMMPVERQIYMNNNYIERLFNRTKRKPEQVFSKLPVYCVNADHGTIKRKEYQAFSLSYDLGPPPHPTPPHASEKRWPCTDMEFLDIKLAKD